MSQLKKIAPKNIIVKMPNWLGDVVMATPILADLDRHWPEARITAMCQSNVTALLKHDPHVDDLYDYQRPNGWWAHQHWNIINQLQDGKYDLGVLLTNSFSSAFWFWKGKVQNKIGFKGNLRDLFLDKSVNYPENKESLHQVVTYKHLLLPLGIKISDTSPKLYLTQKERDDAKILLESCGAKIGKQKIVGINPGAAYGMAKCWMKERFREVTVKLLEDPNIYVVYFGDANSATLVNEICTDLNERVINLAGKTTLRELMALIYACSAFLTNDSGPMHIASALQVPLVALFGSTSSVKTGPYSGGVVINKKAECSPCYKRVCPIDFRCMKKIETEEVYEALINLLNSSNCSIKKFHSHL